MLNECSDCTQLKDNHCSVYMLYGFPKACYLNAIQSIPEKLKKLSWRKERIVNILFAGETIVKRSRKNGFIDIIIYFETVKNKNAYLKCGAKVYIYSNKKNVHSFDILLNFQEKTASETFYNLIEKIYTGMYNELKRRKENAIYDVHKTV